MDRYKVVGYTKELTLLRFFPRIFFSGIDVKTLEYICIHTISFGWYTLFPKVIVETEVVVFFTFLW